jgi:hypothetical protein
LANVEFLSTNRRILSWAGLAFLCLAFSVFSWGTGYKLSLYDPPQSESHKIPQAKLLSKNEQTNIAQTSSVSETIASSSSVCATLSGLLLYLVLGDHLLTAPASARRESEVKQPWRFRHRSAFNFFFVLPPPVLA